MTATLPTQEQVDRIAQELAPDVVHIRLHIGQDWSEHPAIYLHIVLSDEASRLDRLRETTQKVSRKLEGALGLNELKDYITYARFRSQSEQTKMQDPVWD
jgi:hypothetical protein